MSNDFTAKSARIAAARAKGDSVSYEIMINEAQRLALVEILKRNSTDTLDDAPLEYWVEMLTNLPRDEAAHPGVTHGFCL